jgi:23S rRNA (pseudouridine1915-N3)-methyltransferase
MRLIFVCVGRLSREYSAVWKHYETMLRPYCAVEVVEVPETPLSMGSAQVKTREAAALLDGLRPSAFTMALDMGGRQFSSEQLSRFLAEKKLHGQSRFQFILGGAAGLDGRILAAADERWSLSALTLPHQMARCVVLEQVYRAVRIERGEPYHH